MSPIRTATQFLIAADGPMSVCTQAQAVSPRRRLATAAVRAALPLIPSFA